MRQGVKLKCPVQISQTSGTMAAWINSAQYTGFFYTGEGKEIIGTEQKEEKWWELVLNKCLRITGDL